MCYYSPTARMCVRYISCALRAATSASKALPKCSVAVVYRYVPSSTRVVPTVPCVLHRTHCPVQTVQQDAWGGEEALSFLSRSLDFFVSLVQPRRTKRKKTHPFASVATV